MDTSSKFFIHTGTHEGSIIGFQGDLQNMEKIYAFKATLGAVKSVYSKGRYLLTGGFDEVIRIYDLKKKKEKGLLTGHEGTITCIKSFENFIFSSAEDHDIIIWKSREWSLLHRLKGHKDIVYDLSIHKSGKILASVGKDKKIILWNLINGTKLFRKTMTFNCFKVSWLTKQDDLAIMSDKIVHIVSQENNQSIKMFQHKTGLNDFILYENYLIVAGENGSIFMWNKVEDYEAESKHIAFKAHEKRVKQIRIFNLDDQDLLVSTSTDGTISFWNIKDLKEYCPEDLNKDLTLTQQQVQAINTIQTYQRLTGLSLNLENDINNTQNQEQNQSAILEEQEEEDDDKQEGFNDDDDDEIGGGDASDNDEGEQQLKKASKQKEKSKKIKKAKRVSFNEQQKQKQMSSHQKLKQSMAQKGTLSQNKKSQKKKFK